MAAGAQINQVKWRANFTDKNNSPYSISNPSAYLSPRALARRTAQNIQITASDLPVNPWYVDSVRNTGVTILNVSKWFNSVTFATMDTIALQKIRNFPFVAGIDTLAILGRAPQPAEPAKSGATSPNNSRGKKSRSGTQSLDESSAAVDDETFQTWDYGNAYAQAHMLATDYLHDMGYRGEGMLIAVMDAGFYHVDVLPVFDSLRINGQILGTRDMVFPGGNVYSSGTHGMNVLSTMGANQPGVMIGTAPKANYFLIRTEDGGSEFPIEEDNWACGAELADSLGADIINSSLGYTTFDIARWSHDYGEMNGRTSRASLAAVMASRKGLIVVNSAGNSGNNSWKYIGAPADADSILSVGAVDVSGQYANFSSRGPSADGRVKPSVCALGLQATVCSSDGSIVTSNGTSFASPIMAGSVACFWQANRNLNNQQIINAIIQSANRYTNPDTSYGYGIPNLAAAHLILGGNEPADFDAESQMEITPNPFRDQLSVIFYSSAYDDLSVRIYDTSGQLMYSKEKIQRVPGYNYISLKDVAFLEPGVYVIKISSQKHVFTKKLMKAE